MVFVNRSFFFVQLRIRVFTSGAKLLFSLYVLFFDPSLNSFSFSEQ